MRRYPLITREELTEFLEKVGIRPEGIQAIQKTFVTDDQRGKVKQMIELRMKDGETAKEATATTWRNQHFVQRVRMIPVGLNPTKEDISKL